MFEPETVRERLSHRLFGGPILENRFRGLFVEEFVGMALEPDWSYAGNDWAGYDFVSCCQKWKLEVKQSAAKQSWAGKPSQGRFSVREAIGLWSGSVWEEFEEPRRIADIYVFGWHGFSSSDADHTNPEQWDFFVLQQANLPIGYKSLSLKAISKATSSVKLYKPGLDLTVSVWMSGRG
jgi:hypothetical protein